MNISKQTILSIRESLLQWGQDNMRSYPWRHDRNPYRVLVSEFMLHRTQATQVIPVYNHFIKIFPDLEKFYHGKNDTIREILQSLGLSWRITGMIQALIEIYEHFEEVPNNYEYLISIKGIGPYIAGATVCFSTNLSLPLIDTNTVRVTGRLLGLDISGEARRRKAIQTAIANTVDPEHPRNYYYSMIDLAHTICKPHKPSCEVCPLRISCTFINSR